MPALVADIFYHVGAAPKGQEARLEEIVSRQWNLLSSSGLLARSRVHLGIVGDARSPTLAMMLNDSRVVVAARTAVGYECVTMSPLWYHARSVAHLPHAHQAPVLYLHSKGVGRAGRLRANVDDWTRAMEFFLVEQWRDALATMDREGTETAGIEMCGTLSRTVHRYTSLQTALWVNRWPHENRLPRAANQTWHYSGNFWWARPSYLAALPDPLCVSRRGTERYECGEDWASLSLPSASFASRRERPLSTPAAVGRCCAIFGPGGTAYCTGQGRPWAHKAPFTCAQAPPASSAAKLGCA